MPTPPLTPEQRSQRARIANATRWSRVPYAERAAQTQAARDALWRKYLDAVPPEVTDPAEREALARQARRADLTRASLKASRARTARAAAARQAAQRGQEAAG